MANKIKKSQKKKSNSVKRKKKNNKKKNKFQKRHLLWIVCLLVVLVIVVSIFHVFKNLPHGVSKISSETKTNHVELLTDVTYKSGNKMHYEHEIFDKVNETINEANDFIIMDMFLFNNYKTGDKTYPNITHRLTQSLIAKKKENPNIRIIVITDPINSFYGSYTPRNIKALKANNIDVHYTDLSKLRDSNPIYSGTYRTFFQWFGNSENGKLNNPLSSEGPDVTVRGYLKILNMKANHRKTLVTEKHGMVLSSNPHDPSGYHQNVGVRVTGPIQNAIIKSEIAVANMSGAQYSASDFKINNNSWRDDATYSVQLATEGKIKEQILKNIKKSQSKDRISIGMFYLSDRDVINELIKASKRNVQIKLILDINKEAFGKEKPGVPNKPVASELVNRSKGNIKVKWALSNGEQFHSKYLLFEQHENKNAAMILGSSNLTRRNIEDYNLETDIIIKGKQDDEAFTKLSQNFNKAWDNKKYTITAQYDEFKDESLWKKVLYRIQEKTGLSSF
ncbi:phospholipase D-like domain-containing protein [Mammaliicoccus fleurettii]|uniref:phospholipase D-like domain-containing protein n=1 Tax=Mammaliicoccus fleurettii TaxID=150056 RepID=UPI002DBB9A17|nr:phospholipase D-like domain-containing protein [Mammaliicoccus fleurettii]MEB7724292.1 phospholipase D-like domain-containing protein [Mammaliicoccus fleurettii]